ncbi:DUF484 family protein [Pelagibaculum spongiae]|uniref:DUF484 domain-containing protein n=1 Tax=Pelagibaculum spongiae TaxID=2080658 RepID=A0A2V1GSX0_9GAMM|nr:DUF484 family protein [Pelagibaculum spongiae]PVZ65621.1 DUF484 domain-containing protein [Pelagibaculum spongiae]
MSKPTAETQKVIDYLRKHPDFFESQQELLCSLQLGHDTGGNAISLIERQVQILQKKLVEREKQTQDLITVAHENNRLYESAQQFTLKLLDARTLDQIAAQLECALKNDFKCQVISLKLFSDHDQAGSYAFNHPEKAHRALNRLLGQQKPLCGRLSKIEMTSVFDDQAEEVQSAALIPLEGGLGVLGIGSHDPEHFRGDLGTLFLVHMGKILTRCLQHLEVKPLVMSAADA